MFLFTFLENFTFLVGGCFREFYIFCRGVLENFTFFLSGRPHSHWAERTFYKDIFYKDIYYKGIFKVLS